MYIDEDKNYAVTLKEQGFDYVTRNQNYDLYAHISYPDRVFIETRYEYKGVWQSDYMEKIDNERFKFITWLDDEPTSLYRIIKGIK